MANVFGHHKRHGWVIAPHAPDLVLHCARGKHVPPIGDEGKKPASKTVEHHFRRGVQVFEDRAELVQRGTGTKHNGGHVDSAFVSLTKGFEDIGKFLRPD